MGPFIKGFAEELVKLSATPQHERMPSPPGAANDVSNVLAAVSGPSANPATLSTPMGTNYARRNEAPTPMTIPNSMVGRVFS